MKRAPCVAGRATTCWKAHREGDESKTPLVIKDSWQYPEREEEGLLLREATEKGVINVAKYYHHHTVQVGDKVDDIRDNVRKGLDMTKATNFRPERSDMSPGTGEAGDVVRKGRTTSISSVGCKRSSSRTDAPLPPSKRTCSSSPTKGGRDQLVQNRVHRRVIICDYGKPIYKASSRIAVLAALEDCIKGGSPCQVILPILTGIGYESLHIKAGMLQGDISTGNLMMREDGTAFLIDLDLAIKEQREQPSGARGKTGTRAFMAIGLLLGEKHSFMHDLESFFWVLFWICIHYNGPDRESIVTEFDCWNYEDATKLAKLKLGTVAKEAIFVRTVTDNFTSYYEPLIPWINRLRRVVFPMDKPWEREDLSLYSKFREVLRQARQDPKVLGGP